MIVKDAEAPEYECPQAMTSDKYVYCRGSRCMAWRWADAKHCESIDPARPYDDRYEPSKTHGYCGLAGRP